MRIVLLVIYLCSSAVNFGSTCDVDDCQEKYDEVDDVISRVPAPRFACRALNEYIECLADQLGDCPIPHRSAIQHVKSRWTKYVSTCNSVLPFQDEDSGETTVTVSVQNGVDQVRNQLNGAILLPQPAQPSLIQRLVSNQPLTQDRVLGKLAGGTGGVLNNIKEIVKETVDEVIDSSREIQDRVEDVIENVRDMVISKINSAHPIIQQLADKIEEKIDELDDSKVVDNDNALSKEIDSTKSEEDLIKNSENNSVEENFDNVVDFLNYHLSADDGHIKTDLEEIDSNEVEDSREDIVDDTDVSKDTNNSQDHGSESYEENASTGSIENIDDSEEDGDSNENDDFEVSLDKDNDSNLLDVLIDVDNSDENILATDDSDENEVSLIKVNSQNDDSNENDKDSEDLDNSGDDSHEHSKEDHVGHDDSNENGFLGSLQVVEDSDENNNQDSNTDLSDENNGNDSDEYDNHEHSEDSNEHDESIENDNMNSDENNDSHEHGDSQDDSHEHSENRDDSHEHGHSSDEHSHLSVLTDPSTGTANIEGNSRRRSGTGVGGVHQYSSLGDDDSSGSFIAPWTTLLVLCVALVM